MKLIFCFNMRKKKDKKAEDTRIQQLNKCKKRPMNSFTVCPMKQKIFFLKQHTKHHAQKETYLLFNLFKIKIIKKTMII